MRAPDCLEGNGAVGRGDDREALALKISAHESLDLGVVIDHQHRRLELRLDRHG